MMTKKQYVEYLVSTPKNCTCTYLAEHLEGVSHDVVNDFLRQKRVMPREVWQLVKDRLEDSKAAFLIVDDSVHDKRYSRFIELVRAQYSGNEHRVVRGIGVVSLVHSAGKDAAFYPIDYRVYAPDGDGKTKNDHFQEMFVNAVDQKQMKARTILFDGWYRYDLYRQEEARTVSLNPTGLVKSWDPEAPYAARRVVKGGSYLCAANYCVNYRPSARRGTDWDTGMSHTGFRCVMAPQTQPVVKGAAKS